MAKSYSTVKKSSKLILLNARMSKKSFSRWRLLKKFSAKLLNQFDSILPQSKETKDFIEFFDTENIYYFGNLKFISSNELINKTYLILKEQISMRG